MVNKKFRYFRMQCNLTQHEIAKEIGVKRTRVARWEAGLEEIDDENYKQLAKLFGVSVRRLKGKADKPHMIKFVSCNEEYEDASIILYVVSFLVFAIGLAAMVMWIKTLRYADDYLYENSNSELNTFSEMLNVITNNYLGVAIIILTISFIIFFIGLALKHIEINKDF